MVFTRGVRKVVQIESAASIVIHSFSCVRESHENRFSLQCWRWVNQWIYWIMMTLWRVGVRMRVFYRQALLTSWASLAHNASILSLVLFAGYIKVWKFLTPGGLWLLQMASRAGRDQSRWVIVGGPSRHCLQRSWSEGICVFLRFL